MPDEPAGAFIDVFLLSHNIPSRRTPVPPGVMTILHMNRRVHSSLTTPSQCVACCSLGCGRHGEGTGNEDSSSDTLRCKAGFTNVLDGKPLNGWRPALSTTLSAISRRQLACDDELLTGGDGVDLVAPPPEVCE